MKMAMEIESSMYIYIYCIYNTPNLGMTLNDTS